MESSRPLQIFTNYSIIIETHFYESKAILWINEIPDSQLEKIVSPPLQDYPSTVNVYLGGGEDSSESSLWIRDVRLTPIAARNPNTTVRDSVVKYFHTP